MRRKKKGGGRRKEEEEQSQKRQMVSGTRALQKQVVIEVEGGSKAAAPLRPMTYAFTNGEISPSPSSRPKTQPQDQA